MDRIGPFRLLERVGAGGMGVVWRAVDDRERPVALKTLRADSARTRRALLREVSGLARLRHPGIAGLLDHGIHAGQPWYAMTWIDGAPLDLEAGPAVTLALDDWDTGPEPIPTSWKLAPLLTLFWRLCGTLAWLHGEGIVHRDLKPGNVLVRPDGWPILIDFGLAGRFAGGHSREAVHDGIVRAGTPGMVAPEQRAGALVDARADLYSLGCMLHLGLTGLLPPVPRELDDLVARLLAPRPEDRPGHAEDVARALADLGADTTPWPGSPAPRPYVYRPRIAGRAAELAAIEEVVRAGRGVVLIQGPAGSGRSRLVLEATARAWAARSRPLTVAASGADLPAAIGEVVEHLGTEGLECLDPVLSRLFPALAPLLGESTGAAPLDRLESALLALLSALARDRPIVLALDDLDRLDPLTVALVARIRRDTPPRIAVVATVGDAERLPVDLVGGVTVLADLDGPAVARMVQDLLAERSVEQAGAARLAARTQGRPLLVVEALRTGVALGLLTREQGRWRLARPLDELLPHSEDDVVTDLFLQRVDRLPAATREVLAVASVGGAVVDPDALRALLPGTDVGARLAELVREGLLDGEGELRFVHDRLAEALAEALPPARRVALHGAFADHLEGHDGPSLARHLTGAGRLQEAREAWLRHARAAEHQGLLLAAVAAWRHAAALPGGDDVETAKRIVAAELSSGRRAEAAAFARQALAKLDPTSGPALELRQSLAGALVADDPEGALALARETADLARAGGVEVATALASVGQILWYAGRLPEARAAIDEALALESRPEKLPPMLAKLAVILAFERRRADAIACLRRALALQPAPDVEQGLLSHLVMMELWGGRLEQARQHLARVEDLARATGSLRGLLWARVVLGQVELLADRPEAAALHARHVAARARDLAIPDLVEFALVVLAEAALVSGDAAEAEGALAEVLARNQPPAVARLLECRRLRLLGDLEGARRALAAATRLQGDDRPMAAIEAIHLARAEGRDDSAEVEALQRLLAAFPDPIEPRSVVGRALATLESR